MNCRSFVCSLIMLASVICQSAVAQAAKCSFSKNVQANGVAYNITSNSAGSCSVQVVNVTAKRSGKRIAAMKSDVDSLAYAAHAVDINGDKTPELVIINRASGQLSSETVDVYWLDGTALRKVTIPEPDDRAGYKGGDSYYLEDHLIVRTFPVYRDGDVTGKPGGGSRTLKYEFKDGHFSLYVLTEDPQQNVAANDNSVKPEKEKTTTEVQPVAAPPEKKRTKAAVTAVNVTGNAIEITGDDVRTAKFKVMKLEKPERIAIDITGADSALVGKKIAIDKHGISKARVGRNKRFLRIVLDSRLAAFPAYEIKQTETGISVEFK